MAAVFVEYALTGKNVSMAAGAGRTPQWRSARSARSRAVPDLRCLRFPRVVIAFLSPGGRQSVGWMIPPNDQVSDRSQPAIALN